MRLGLRRAAGRQVGRVERAAELAGRVGRVWAGAGACATPVLLPELGSPVLEPNLHARLAQLNPVRELLSAIVRWNQQSQVSWRSLLVRLCHASARLGRAQLSCY